jgi:hypothetical protein
MADDLDRMARETSEYRREEEPPPPPLTGRALARSLLVGVVAFAGLALLQGEPALSGMIGGATFVVLMLAVQVWRRRRA